MKNRQGKPMRILALIMAVSLAVAASSSLMSVTASAEGVITASEASELTSLTDLQVNYQTNPIGIEQENIRFGWKMDSSVIGQGQTAYRIQLAKGSADGDVVWDSGTVQSDISSAIPYSGDGLDLETRYYWTVTVTDAWGNKVSETAYFHTGCDWNDAQWIYSDVQSQEAPYFRTEQKLNSSKVSSATLYITSLGIYDAYINGEEVKVINEDGTITDDMFNPGWTEYYRYIYYTGYDVTDYFDGQSDDLVFGIQVGRGWYAGGISSWNDFPERIGTEISALAKLIVTFEDGSKQVIDTNIADWKSFDDGPLLDNDFFNGVEYDARKEYLVEGWNEVGFNDSSWSGVSAKTDYDANLIANNANSVHVEEEKLYPVNAYVYDDYNLSVTDGGTSEYATGEIINVENVDLSDGPVTLKAGETIILDIGQNIAGYNTITVSGDKDTEVYIRQAERINDGNLNSEASNGGSDGPKGTLYWAGLTDGGQFRSALNDKPFSDYYYLNGDGQETFTPQYTFHGYQYVEVTASDDIVIYDLYAESITSVGEQLGTITTNNASVNKLFSNSQWSQKANYLSIPTDCPNRAERLGWTGDAQIYALTGTYNYDVTAFLESYNVAMDDYAVASGVSNGTTSYGTYVPAKEGNAFGLGGIYNIGWSDAGVIIPWVLYQQTGDTSYIENYYETMDTYMDEQYARGYNNFCLGDWVAFETTSRPYITAAYYAYCSELMSKMSAAIGYQAGVDKYNARFEEHVNYMIDNHLDTLSTQTELLWALKLGVYNTEEQKQELYTKLRENIANEDQSIRSTSSENTLSIGFLGINVLLPSVTSVGGADAAYDLLLQDEYPSWLNQINNGATSMWEQWDAYSSEYSYGSSSMNSFNHYAYGAVSEWMYQYMVGITTDEDNAGYKSIVLQPTIDTGLQYNSQSRITEVEGSYESAYGYIESNWTSDGTNMTSYETIVPANTTATLYLPVDDSYTVGNLPLGVTFVNFTEYNGILTAMFELASGSYSFDLTDGEITALIDDGYSLVDETEARKILRETIADAQQAMETGEYENMLSQYKEDYLAVLDEAIALYNDVNATDAELFDMFIKLAEQLQNLGYQNGDNTLLVNLIALCDGLDLSQYTSETAEALKSALEAARNVASGEALQEDIDNALNALAAAYRDLRLIPSSSSQSAGDPSTGDPSTGGSSTGGSNTGGSSNNTPGKVAKTGDTTIIFVVIAVISATGMIIISRRKKNN